MLLFYKEIIDMRIAKISFWLLLAVPYCIFALLPILAAIQASQGCVPKQSLLTQVPSATPASNEVKAPDLQMLAEMGASGAGFSAEQLEEARQLENQQVEQAKEWLAEVDSKQRVAGAEQLSAYPNPTSENYLVAALQDDADDSVRAAAAKSLGVFSALKTQSLDALVAALQDMDETVRFNAFNSLQILINRPGTSPKEGRAIRGKLNQLLKKNQLSEDTREAIRYYLLEQEGVFMPEEPS